MTGRQVPSEVSVLISILEFLAALSATLFGGAALYINVVEHPARMGLETRILLVRWGQLHTVRTILGLAGAVIFIWLMLEA